jgi:3-oxoacyl-(acyl-carrier-protein) synthase
MEAMSEPDSLADRAFGQPSTLLDPERFQGARTAEVRDFDPKHWLGPRGHRNFDRLTKFLIVAAKQALEHAGLKREGAFVAASSERVGICSATAYGSLDSITELNRVAELEDPRYINPTRFPNTVINAAAGYVSIWEGLRGPNTTIVDGNCGALDAVLTAETHLRNGRGDAFLVGGGEVLSDPLYLAFQKLGILADVACRSEGRAGEVKGRGHGLCLGEGAAFFCVEPSALADERGAARLGRILGYGTAFEPPPSEAMLVAASAEGITRAIVAAIQDAGLEPGDIDAVACSEAGLAQLDQAEERGIAEAFGGRPVAVLAPKRHLGETFGAAGALAMAETLAWFDGSRTASLVSGVPPDELRTVLVTAVGFYGNASAVVLRR